MACIAKDNIVDESISLDRGRDKRVPPIVAQDPTTLKGVAPVAAVIQTIP